MKTILAAAILLSLTACSNPVYRRDGSQIITPPPAYNSANSTDVYRVYKGSRVDIYGDPEVIIERGGRTGVIGYHAW